MSPRVGGAGALAAAALVAAIVTAQAGGATAGVAPAGAPAVGQAHQAVEDVRIVALGAPAVVRRGAVIALRARVDRPVADALAVVERRTAAGWRPVARDRLSAVERGEVRLRARFLGPQRLRVRLGGVVSPSVVLRVVAPGRPRVPVGLRPRALAAGTAAVWVLGDERAGATVRALHPRSGRQVGRITHLGTPADGLAVAAGAVWTMGRDGAVRRIDPRTRAVTAAPDAHCPGATVVAGGAAVWVVGACRTTSVPGRVSALQRVARRLDPATGAAVGEPVAVDLADLVAGAVRGDTLWLWGAAATGADGGVLVRVALRSGAVSSPTAAATEGGPPALLAAGPRDLWTLRGGFSTVLPRAGLRLGPTIHRALTAVAPAGSAAWVASALRGGGTGDLDTARLRVIPVPLTGPRRLVAGPSVGVGTVSVAAPPADTPLPGGPSSPGPPPPIQAVHTPGVLWVLVAAEGGLLRVPLPRP